MTSMLEKAVEAVMLVERRKGDAFDVGPECAEDIARAVLMAVREPDDEVMWQACEAGNRPLHDKDFPAIIDAILNNPNPPSVKDETE